MDYNARFYSPDLGTFTQPDTIVPNPTNPQSWNRYSYVQGNPIRYNDPTGHALECGLDPSGSGCGGGGTGGGGGDDGGSGGLRVGTDDDPVLIGGGFCNDTLFSTTCEYEAHVYSTDGPRTFVTTAQFVDYAGKLDFTSKGLVVIKELIMSIVNPVIGFLFGVGEGLIETPTPSRYETLVELERPETYNHGGFIIEYQYIMTTSTTGQGHMTGTLHVEGMQSGEEADLLFTGQDAMHLNYWFAKRIWVWKDHPVLD